MANKFKKAIENRSDEILNAGKSNEINLKKAKENHINNKITENTKIEKDTRQNQSTFDLNSIIEKNKKTSSNKTYYLEDKVIEAIKKIAKKQKISESKLVNDILKHILNVK